MLYTYYDNQVAFVNMLIEKSEKWKIRRTAMAKTKEELAENKQTKENVVVIVEIEPYPFYMTKVGQIIIATVVGLIVIVFVMTSILKRKKHSKMSKKSNSPIQQVNAYAIRKEEQIVEPKRIRKDIFSTSDMFGNIAKKEEPKVEQKLEPKVEKNEKVENKDKPKIPPKKQ